MCTGELSVVALRGDAAPGVLGCGIGHRFDVARQGYVSLLSGAHRGLASDTTEMVAARTRVLSDDGPFARLRARIADTVAEVTVGGATDEQGPAVLDVGSGTGQYVATCLDRLPMSAGIGIDLSKACTRSTARAHPRLAGVVADAWSRLPVADSSVRTVLSVFAPRNVADFARVLRGDGHLVVAAPEANHLGELIEPMGMLRVGEDKYDGLLAATQGRFVAVSSEVVGYRPQVSSAQVVDLVAMGPSAFHRSVDEITSRATAFAGSAGVSVTIAVRLTVLRPV
ncbi:methyltransferase domain-containing protein [Gordonia sp. CPCC 205333]|uniref:methyltransferase domain-containing protein n=1 Tax=Gordonia sp. CPCC 205333 TaxID=3140790 RepID=UPI003AF3726B